MIKTPALTGPWCAVCCAGRAAYKRWEACEASGEAYTYRPPNAEELKEAQADAAAAKSAKAAAKALVNAAGETPQPCCSLKRLRPSCCATVAFCALC